MPATGIEPVLYRYNRILSPARLPVPPRRHYSTATYIRKPSLTSYLNMLSYRTILNGQRWIRTTEASCSRFTVCPLWPLGNLPILVSTNVLTRIDYNISFFIVQDKILYFLHFIFQHRSRMWQQRDGDPSIFHLIFFRHE